LSPIRSICRDATYIRMPHSRTRRSSASSPQRATQEASGNPVVSAAEQRGLAVELVHQPDAGHAFDVADDTTPPGRPSSAWSPSCVAPRDLTPPLRLGRSRSAGPTSAGVAVNPPIGVPVGGSGPAGRRGPGLDELGRRRRGVHPPQGDRGDVGAELVDQAGGEHWLTVAAPPAMATSRAPAPGRAWSRAARMPSVMNLKVVPPCIASGSPGWWVSTNTGRGRAGPRPTSPASWDPSGRGPVRRCCGPSRTRRRTRPGRPRPGSRRGVEHPGVQPVHWSVAERLVRCLARTGEVAAGRDRDVAVDLAGHGTPHPRRHRCDRNR
jgi:hypothetical protein